MTRQVTSLRQRNGRYSQGGYTDHHPEIFGVESFPERLGWWEKRNIARNYDDIFLVIPKSTEGRPDLISYHVYGEPVYGWLVMQYNSIVDPIQELKRGITIRLPTPSRLRIYIISRPLRTI
jgi:hypothetical protein